MQNLVFYHVPCHAVSNLQVSEPLFKNPTLICFASVPCVTCLYCLCCNVVCVFSLFVISIMPPKCRQPPSLQHSIAKHMRSTTFASSSTFASAPVNPPDNKNIMRLSLSDLTTLSAKTLHSHLQSNKPSTIGNKVTMANRLINFYILHLYRQVMHRQCLGQLHQPPPLNPLPPQLSMYPYK